MRPQRILKSQNLINPEFPISQPPLILSMRTILCQSKTYSANMVLYEHWAKEDGIFRLSGIFWKRRIQGKIVLVG